LILVSPRTKFRVWILILALCASGVAVFFQKEIRVAYHRNRMFAAMENYTLLYNFPHQGPKPTRFDRLKFIVFRMSDYKEGEAMKKHEEALIALGHLEKREFTFTNKVVKGEGHCWPSLRQQITNTFDDSHWWSCGFLETNRLDITATPQDMVKWEKLISDFDR